MNYNIAVLPGDGIGPEVMGEGTEVLKQVAQLYGFTVNLEPGIVGGASIDAHGKPLTDAVLNLAKQSDAVLLGAMGGPNGTASIIRFDPSGRFWRCAKSWVCSPIFVRLNCFPPWPRRRR